MLTEVSGPPGLENAKGWFASIVEMVEAYERGEELDQGDEPRERIEESVLSVEVRGDWHTPGSEDGQKATQYRILLTTGGPALQITGDLNEHGEPETADLETQDWFKPWTPVHPNALLDLSKGNVPLDDAIAFGEKVRSTLLTFASAFWFGER